MAIFIPKELQPPTRALSISQPQPQTPKPQFQQNQTAPQRQQTYQMEVSRGGRKIQMTSGEIAHAYDLLRQYSEGQPPSMSGRPENVKKLYGYILEKAQQEGYAVGMPSQYREVWRGGVRTIEQPRIEVEQPLLMTTPEGIKPVSHVYTSVTAPAGFSPRQAQDLFFKYQRQLPPQQKKLSQFEQARIITSSPKYQQELQQIYAQPEVQEKMQRYESTFYEPRYEPTSTFGLRTVEYVPPTRFEEFSGRISEVEAFEQQQLRQLEEQPYISLLKKGELPSAVRKGFRDVGREYFTTIGRGAEAGLGLPPLTKEEIETGAEIFGTFFMTGFFSPVFQTGAMSEQEAIAKQLSKSRFDKLGKFLSKVERELVKKKNWKAQTKYLNDLAKKINPNNREAVEGFKKIVEELYEAGIYKGVPINAQMVKEETQTLYQIMGRIPTMKGAGTVFGISQIGDMQIQPERVRETDWITGGVVMDASQIQKTPLWTFGMGGMDTFGLQAEKEQELEKQKPSVISKLFQPQAPKQDQPQKPVERFSILSMEKQAQPTPQKQVPKQTTAGDFFFPSETTQGGGGGGVFGIPLFTKGSKGEREGYHSFALKESATKGKKAKWIKLTKKPHTEGGAKDVGSRFVDKNISARFKIEPIRQTKMVEKKKKQVLKKFKEKELTRGDNYFKLFQYKFRPYKIRKGRKQPMKQSWVELKKFRLDHPQEVRKIHHEKRLSNPIFSGFGGGSINRRKSSKGKRKNTGYFRL